MRWLSAWFAFFPSLLFAQSPSTWAVVRIPSHGATATVIWTQPGKTYLLGCAHAYEGAARAKAMKLDVQTPSGGSEKRAAIRLVAVDYQADLSLVELGDGPLAYECPIVSDLGHPARVLSSGCDKMAWPPVVQPATIVGHQGRTTYTRENPVPGRSGGALIDADRGVLIGVVQGYETSGPRRGMYVSHAAVTQFLRKQGWGGLGPNVQQMQLPQQMLQCPT
jgi:hypothetical protein